MKTRGLRTWFAVASLCAGVGAQTFWTQASISGPAGRWSPAMAFDSLRGQSVMFGGYGPFPGYQGDAWSWDGATWSLAPTGPSPRAGHAMVYDNQRDRIVLFGGDATPNPSILATPSNETWEFNGLSWSLVSTNGPPARTGHKMAFDSQRGRTVMFGGPNPSPLHPDTWEWDGTSWAQVNTSGPTRAGHAMAYDAHRGRVVLFGGHYAGQLGDTWEWDGVSWTQIPVVGPAPRQDHQLIYNPQRARIMLFGGWSGSSYLGDSWEWDGTTWAQIGSSGPARGGHVMTYDSGRNRVVLFGGQSNGLQHGDTWEAEVLASPSSATAFGNGCGTPALSLSPVPTALPSIGTTALASLANTPSPLVFVAVGWSKTVAGPFLLPLPLDGFGMTGCLMLQSTEVLGLQALVTGPTTASFGVGIPSLSSLIGLHLYLQGWALAPGMNPAGVITSNGLDWGIGF